MADTVRLEMKISKELYDELDRIATAEGTNKGELLRKATNLFLFARDAAKHGRKIAAVEGDRVVTEVVGL